MRVLRGVVGLVVWVVGGLGLVWAQQQIEKLPPEARAPLLEKAGVAQAPPPHPHRVYVMDPGDFLVINKVYVVDGDTGKVLGTFDTGYLANIVLAPDHSAIYVAETFYSRGARGKREDVVSVYDPRTLAPVAEIDIPDDRVLIMPKLPHAGITPDGTYLLVFNVNPASSVSVVDVKARKLVAQIETPGCYLLYPLARRSDRFATLCADGGFSVVQFDASGKHSTQKLEPFHTQDESLMDNPAYSDDGRVVWVSYKGTVFMADMTGDTPRIADKWSILTAQDRAQNWWPGGWQPVAYQRRLNRLYVLMHQGTEFTHKEPGTEIWVFDAAKKSRIQRIRLPHPANSVAVSHDDKPLLYAVSAHEKTLYVYDASTGRLLRQVDGLGYTPYVLYVPTR
jgi:methylamine dehydrogenase heavy chain